MGERQMKIHIDKILNERIYFSTDYGMVKGIWKENNQPVKEDYDVELDVEKIYDYNDLVICDKKEYKIQMLGEKIQLTLLLSDYAENGEAVFRLGDSIMIIETNYDKRFYELKNSFVTILVEQLYIYDMNL